MPIPKAADQHEMGVGEGAVKAERDLMNPVQTRAQRGVGKMDRKLSQLARNAVMSACGIGAVARSTVSPDRMAPERLRAACRRGTEIGGPSEDASTYAAASRRPHRSRRSDIDGDVGGRSEGAAVSAALWYVAEIGEL